ncbi:CGNR zinc finger domain-containing protein [Janibacter sp. DB-40]|uniref:CGNR zinc finger domain-containing protein n=1 Tax=Janibacter sp. DB-40 TaxID=3028808 RepID=UPI002405D95D|nr:CGNR zinc finger domain-containing protein [Janibacter sp. DB-40]
MTFAHDTEVALRTAAALVNTAAGDDEDSLTTTDGLRDFYTEWGWTGRVTGDAQELDQVRALRPRLRAAWGAGSDEELAELVNTLLREGRALPQVVTHGDYGWHIHATPSDAPLAVRMQVEAAMALVDVVRADERSRLRTCAAEDCQNVLVDLSRNRSRRYCEGGCGNRLAAAAYRSRREG